MIRCIRISVLLFLMPSLLLAQVSIEKPKKEKRKIDPAFPYRLNWRVDAPVIAGAVASCVIGLPITPQKLTPLQVQQLNPYDVNSFDRIAIGTNDHTANLTSDIIQYSMVVFAGVSTMAYSKMKGAEFGTLFAIFAETYTLNFGITYAFKNIVGRARPYVYTPGFGENKESFGNADFQSMISGHSSTVFMSAVFLSKTFSDIYPHSPAKYAVWAVSLSLATTGAVLRIAAGKHYPTDIIAGAVVGGAIGYLVPWLHRKEIIFGKKKNITGKIVPMGAPQGFSLGMRFRL